MQRERERERERERPRTEGGGNCKFHLKYGIEYQILENIQLILKSCGHATQKSIIHTNFLVALMTR